VPRTQENADLASPSAKKRPLKIEERPSFWYLAKNRFTKNRLHIYTFLYKMYKKYICCCSVGLIYIFLFRMKKKYISWVIYIYFYSERIKNIYLFVPSYPVCTVRRSKAHVQYCAVPYSHYRTYDVQQYEIVYIRAREYRNRFFPQPPVLLCM
jgi:hypothetical protein